MYLYISGLTARWRQWCQAGGEGGSSAASLLLSPSLPGAAHHWTGCCSPWAHNHSTGMISTATGKYCSKHILATAPPPLGLVLRDLKNKEPKRRHQSSL